MRHSKTKGNQKEEPTCNLIDQKVRLSEIMNLWENQYAYQNTNLTLVLCDCQSNFKVQRQYRVLIETGRSQVDDEDYSNNYDNQFERFFKKTVKYTQQPNRHHQQYLQTEKRKRTFQDLTNQAPKLATKVFSSQKMLASREQNQYIQSMSQQKSSENSMFQSEKVHQYNIDNQDCQQLQGSVSQTNSVTSGLPADQSINQKDSIKVNNHSLSIKNNFSFNIQKDESDIRLQVDSKPEQDEYKPIGSPRKIEDNLPFQIIESQMCRKSVDNKQQKISMRHSQNELHSQSIQKQSEIEKPIVKQVQDSKQGLNKLKHPNVITVHELKIRYLEDRKAPVRVVKLLSPYK